MSDLSIKKVLMERDGLSEKEAEEEIEFARHELNERLANGDDCNDICEEFFGLEPDYIFDLMY